MEGKIVSDTCGPSQKQYLNDLNVFQKEVPKEDKFTLQKKLDDIAVKKQQEELVMLSRETVRLIRVSPQPSLTTGINMCVCFHTQHNKNIYKTFLLFLKESLTKSHIC